MRKSPSWLKSTFQAATSRIPAAQALNSDAGKYFDEKSQIYRTTIILCGKERRCKNLMARCVLVQYAV